MALVISSYKCKYLRKNLGLNSCVIPSISCKTRTCPSTSGPAPIPIIGMFTLSATFLANSAGIFSNNHINESAATNVDNSYKQ